MFPEKHVREFMKTGTCFRKGITGSANIFVKIDNKARTNANFSITSLAALDNYPNFVSTI